jgi:putative hemolysin
LVPKHLALRNAEGFACAMAPLMTVVSRAAAPVAWLLDARPSSCPAPLGRRPDAESTVTEQDIRTVVAEAEAAGAIEVGEHAMIARCCVSTIG